MKIFNPILFFALLLVGNYSLTAQICLVPVKPKTDNPTAFSVRVLWSEGSEIETIHYRPLGATQWQFVRNINSPFVLPGLSAGTIYEYYIGSDCPGFQGTPIHKFSTLAACNPAINLTASTLYSNSVQLDWTRGVGIMSEIVAYKEVNATEYTRIATPFGPPSFRLEGLKPNTQYVCVIESECATSSQPNQRGLVMSPPIQFTTKDKANCEEAQFFVSSNGYYSINSSWYHSNVNVTGYEICYKKIGSNGEATCKTLANNINSFSFPTKPDESYEVILKYKCTDGTIYSHTRTVKTDALPPCSIEASYSNITQNSIQINFIGNLANINKITIFFKRSFDPQYYSVNINPITAFIGTSLDPDTEYSIYFVASCNGNVDLTNTYHFRTLPNPCPTATNLTAGAPEPTGATYKVGADWSYSAATNPGALLYVYLEENIGGIWANSMLKYGNVPLTLDDFPADPNARIYFQSLEPNKTYRYSVEVRCGASSTMTSHVFTTDLMMALTRDKPKLDSQQETKTSESNNKDVKVVNLNATLNKLPSKNIGVISISPNPTKDFVTATMPEEGFDQIRILNLEGRIVKNISIQAHQLSQNIDCSDLSNGLYIMMAKGKEKVANTRFVKQ